MVNLAANLSTMFRELPLVDRFARAKSMGFRAVELQFPYEMPAPDLADMLRVSNLKLVLINAPAGDLPAGDRGLVLEDSQRFDEAMAMALHYAVLAECRQIHVLIGRHAEGLQGDRRRMAVSRLRSAATSLARHGIDLMLEALNPHDQPCYALPNVQAAEELRREIGSTHVRLLFDTYHVARTGDDPVACLRQYFSAVGHIQISAVPDRTEPTPDEVRPLFSMLDALGYGGHVGCEYNPRSETVAGLAWASDYGIGPKPE